MFYLFALSSDEPEVFLPKFSQMAIFHAAHFQRVVKHSVPWETPKCVEGVSLSQKMVTGFGGTLHS